MFLFNLVDLLAHLYHIFASRCIFYVIYAKLAYILNKFKIFVCSKVVDLASLGSKTYFLILTLLKSVH